LPGIQTLFDKGKHWDAIAQLIMARSALDEVLGTYGWSPHLLQWTDPDSGVRSAKQNGTDCGGKLEHGSLAHADA
jgi:hypothetical protein